MKFKFLKNKEKNANLSSNINKKTREKSTGRSMVEMLGVLAIIGVLSIGGIQGYTIAMRKYRANEILNVANKFAAIIWTQTQQLMINDPENHYWDDGEGNHYTDMSEEKAKELANDFGFGPVYFPPYKLRRFENAGLGGLPSGVSDVFCNGIYTGKSGIGVAIHIIFENHALCETAKSMTDTEAEKADYWCDESSWEYDADKKLSLYFYQK